MDRDEILVQGLDFYALAVQRRNDVHRVIASGEVTDENQLFWLSVVGEAVSIQCQAIEELMTPLVDSGEWWTMDEDEWLARGQVMGEVMNPTLETLAQGIMAFDERTIELLDAKV